MTFVDQLERLYDAAVNNAKGFLASGHLICSLEQWELAAKLRHAIDAEKAVNA